MIPLPVKLALGGLAALALALGAAYGLSRVRTAQIGRQRERLLEDVGLLQAALLPAVPDRLAGVSVSVAYHPAAGLAAGGDFYDAFELDGGRIAFLVGDISGHGREALSHTTLVHYTLRAHLEAGTEPRRVLDLTDQTIGEELGGNFATVIVGTYDPSTGALTFASAGHPAPILSGPTAYEPVIELSSPPIGLGLGPTGCRETRILLPAGCDVCLYTDGLVEARVDGALFGGNRLAEILAGLEAETAAQSLIEAVRVEADDVSDDMAACVFNTGERATGDGSVLEELELDVSMLDQKSLERFLLSCRLPADEIPATLTHARAVAPCSDTVVLRVAIDESGTSAEVEPATPLALVAA